MLGVRLGELLHRPFLEAYRPGEEEDPLGRGERRRVGNDAPAWRQRIAQPPRQIAVEIFGASPEKEGLFGERYGGNEERRHEHEEGPRREVLPP